MKLLTYTRNYYNNSTAGQVISALNTDNIIALDIELGDSNDVVVSLGIKTTAKTTPRIEFQNQSGPVTISYSNALKLITTIREFQTTPAINSQLDITDLITSFGPVGNAASNGETQLRFVYG